MEIRSRRVETEGWVVCVDVGSPAWVGYSRVTVRMLRDNIPVSESTHLIRALCELSEWADREKAELGVDG